MGGMMVNEPQEMSPIMKLAGLYRKLAVGLSYLAPLADLALRIYVGNVFWKSGLTKFQSWDTPAALYLRIPCPIAIPRSGCIPRYFYRVVFPGVPGAGAGGSFCGRLAVYLQYHRGDFISRAERRRP